MTEREAPHPQRRREDEALAVVRRKNLSWPTWPRPPLRGRTAAGQRETSHPESEGERGRARRGRQDAAAGRRRGRLARAVNDLTELLDATRRIAAQTRQRMAGTTPDGATRRVSLHDPDARPIRKGRLGKPVEFGNKAQVCDNDDGIVLDHDVQPGNPADGPRMKPAIERVRRRTGGTPRTVAADRGYGETSTSTTTCTDLGVRDVVIPRRGRPSRARPSPRTTTYLPPPREMANRL